MFHQFQHSVAHAYADAKITLAVVIPAVAKTDLW